MNTLWADASVGGLAAEFVLALLAIVGALSTGMGAFMAGIAADA